MKKGTYRIYFILAFLMVVILAFTGCKKKTGEVKDTTSDKVQPTVTVTEAPKDITGEVKEDKPEVTAIPAYKMQNGVSTVKEEPILEENFEDGKTDFNKRGNETVEIVDGKAAEGSKSLFISGRTAQWNGPSIDLSDKMKTGETYVVKASVMYENGPDSIQIDCKVEKNKNEYLNFASSNPKKGQWTDIEGKIVIPDGTTTASVYFETGYGSTDNCDFYVDNVTVSKETATVERGDIPALKDVYKDNFSVGVAATVPELALKRQELIKQQFNSITPGNELKPDSVLDYATCISDKKYDDNPAVNFDRVMPIFEFAKKAGLKMRGHTLVWHSQTPRWFFTVGYSKDANAPFVSKDLMLKRMENYIRQVIEYAQTNYPGMIYAWDVVNEAINPSDVEPGGYRSSDSLWYQVIGPDFVEKAFEYARKYADKDVKLIYNDFNTEDPGKMIYIYDLVKGLKDKGLIDGIGLQTHITIDSPSLVNFQNSLMKYGSLGLEIQITELDMGMTENTDAAYMNQAKRYKRLFTAIKNMDDTGKANITNVTFWGLSDDISWLSKPGVPSYPLLFDGNLLQKPAFWGVVLSPDIPLY